MTVALHDRTSANFTPGEKIRLFAGEELVEHR
jgi:hypothetical protein